MGQEASYSAQWPKIRRGAETAKEEAEHVRKVRDELRAVFVAEGRPMGDDQYGAEFEKSFPLRTKAVFKGFEDYIDELEGVGDGLHVNANTYETAELDSQG
ncbi:hypothetical protein [Nonomuraea sp. NEAU-A123]|uniref:hypothetical protein n=1 Tax=Nonomuraea sp. NEAU-A123 TaxID=2839649 RepID=UPI001BE40F1C|nr:hypothetical protein [Nonomuraea sp. NEAU-A123]MBT2224512.1 hypothetical protein [Nonomuraea sp. NEAU-A123]